MRGFEGTGALLRLAGRRDRVLIPAWTGVFVLMVVGSASATVDLYPTVAARVQAARAINDTGSLVALYGPIYDPTSLGAVAMLKLTGLGAAMVAVLTGILVIRHSRAEEEPGRLELLGATVVGRRAPLTAALVVGAITSAAIGVLSALGLVATGLPVAGSLAFGASWAGAGIAFAAVAAVAAQLTTTARNATGLTMGFLGVTYVLRGIGDTSPRVSWLVWTSPIGWAHRVRAFAGERWGVLVLLSLWAVVLAVGAYALSARRDLGAGLFADRPGPARAGPRLRSPLGLAWRLQRGSLAVWTAAFTALGIVVGSIASDVGSLLDSPNARDLIRRLGGEKGLTDAFLAAELGVLGLITAAYGVHAALRLRSEETSMRAEAVLATDVGRLRWAASHLLVSMAGTTSLALASGLSAGATHALHTGRAADVPRVLGGALVQLPAIWVVLAVVVATFGAGHRVAGISWTVLVAFLLLGEFGALFKLPQRVMDLSPFAHVPQLPGAPLHAVPIVALLGAAAVLSAAGLGGLRRRDIG
jgi:ABC-2 type transport system permease protein